MVEFSETELVRRCQAGEQAAFRELVDHHKDLVYALAVRTSRSRAEADDVAREVFVRVYRGLLYFRGEAKLSTWINRITFIVCGEHRSTGAVVDEPLLDETERLLRSDPSLRAPADFASRMMRHVRRDSWRSEQYVDVGFNATIALAGSLVVAGILMLMNVSGLTALTRDTSGLIIKGLRLLATRAAEAAPTYLAAATLVLMVVVAWWWVERSGSDHEATDR